MTSENFSSESQKEVESLSPTKSIKRPEPAFGWNAYAEQINGRFAMIGFVLLLLIEILTRQDFFTWVGLR